MATPTQNNKFTRAEFVAFKLQIWRDTFNMAMQAAAGRDVENATKAAASAVRAFEIEFEDSVEKETTKSR